MGRFLRPFLIIQIQAFRQHRCLHLGCAKQIDEENLYRNLLPPELDVIFQAVSDPRYEKNLVHHCYLSKRPKMGGDDWTTVLSKSEKRVGAKEKLISSAPVLDIPSHPSIIQRPNTRILYIDLDFASAYDSGLMRFDEEKHWLDTTILDILPNYAATITEIDLEINFRPHDEECAAFQADQTELIRQIAKLLDTFRHLGKLEVRFQMPFKRITWDQVKNAVYFYGMHFKKWDLLYRCEHGEWVTVEYGDEVDRFMFRRLKHLEESDML